MATGIVSIASFAGDASIAWVLVVINLVNYTILWLLTLARLIGYFSRVLADLSDHARGPGFFTLVAGTCVLGSQLAIVAGSYRVASVLWWLGILLWVVIIYAFFAAVTISEEKPTLESGISGAWLMATVSTQSVAVLGTLLAAHADTPSPVRLFFTLCMYLLGCMLYLCLITLILYRFTFFPDCQ